MKFSSPLILGIVLFLFKSFPIGWFLHLPEVTPSPVSPDVWYPASVLDMTWAMWHLIVSDTKWHTVTQGHGGQEQQVRWPVQVRHGLANQAHQVQRGHHPGVVQGIQEQWLVIWCIMNNNAMLSSKNREQTCVCFLFGKLFQISWHLMTQMTISWCRIDCPDGKLTASSFRKIYTKCFPGGNVNEFCDHVFRTFDMDKNGFVDFKEFLLAIDVTSTGTPEEKLQWAFRCE